MTGGYSRYQQQEDIEYMTAAAGLCKIDTAFVIFPHLNTLQGAATALTLTSASSVQGRRLTMPARASPTTTRSASVESGK